MTSRKATKTIQSLKPKLANDKKKIIIALCLMSVAMVIYVGIVVDFLIEGLHGCGSIGFDLFIKISESIALLCMILPLLVCVIAGIYAIKLKNSIIRYLLLVLDVILMITPIIVVIIATSQTIGYLTESYDIGYSPYCW